MYDIFSGDLIRELKGHLDRVAALAFHPRLTVRFASCLSFEFALLAYLDLRNRSCTAEATIATSSCGTPNRLRSARKQAISTLRQLRAALATAMATATLLQLVMNLTKTIGAMTMNQCLIRSTDSRSS